MESICVFVWRPTAAGRPCVCPPRSTAIQNASPLTYPSRWEDYSFGVCKLVQCNGRTGVAAMVDPFSSACFQVCVAPGSCALPRAPSMCIYTCMACEFEARLHHSGSGEGRARPLSSLLSVSDGAWAVCGPCGAVARAQSNTHAGVCLLCGPWG